jgi:hypothetical protein
MAAGQEQPFQMLTADAVKRWLFTDPENAFGVGFRATDAFTETIADGTDGTGNAVIDLGANFKVLGIACEDASGIPQSTDLEAEIAFDVNSPLCDLYEQDDPSTEWAKGDLPTSGHFAFILTHSFGVRKIRLVLSQAASGAAVVFKIYGFHSGG